MRLVIRHVALAALPLALGLAAGWGFAYFQESCWNLVGPLFSAKCRGIQLRWQIDFQTGGTALGCLLSATFGIWLERRRTRRVTTVTDSEVTV
jgi:hypothetical protein